VKYSSHLIISIVLALQLSAATAGSHNAKPGKNPASSATPQQSTAPSGNRQQQPEDAAGQAGDNDWDSDWERETDRERDRDNDRDNGRNKDWARDDDRDRDGNWELERDRERDQDPSRDQPGKGNERSREMLEQRDERKEAKAEYRSDRVPGQEGNSGKDTDDGRADEDASKPWYKFWD
jgi:hypothetical protein